MKIEEKSSFFFLESPGTYAKNKINSIWLEQKYIFFLKISWILFFIYVSEET